MADPICVLKVMHLDCKNCWVELKKVLSRIDGVRSVDVDSEKELATVTGQTNPGILQKEIARHKKKAVVVVEYFDRNPSMNYQNKKSQKEKEKCHSCGGDDDEGKNVHKCEPYVPPKMNEKVCRDRFCKTHSIKPKIPEIIFPMPNIPFQHVPPMNWMLHDAPPPSVRYQDDPFNFNSQGPIRPPAPRPALPPRHYGY